MIDEYIKTSKEIQKTNQLKEKNRKAFSANAGLIMYFLSLCFFIWIILFNYNYIVDMLNHVKDVYQNHLKTEYNSLFLYYLTEIDNFFVHVNANNTIDFNTSFFDIKETTEHLKSMNYYNVNLYELKDKYSFIFYSPIFLSILVFIRGFISTRIFKEVSGNTAASLVFSVLFSMPILIVSSTVSDFKSYQYINEYAKFNDFLIVITFVISILFLVSLINTIKGGLFSKKLNKELENNVKQNLIQFNDIKSNIFESEEEMREVLKIFKGLDESDKNYRLIKEIIDEFKELKAKEVKKMEQVKSVEKIINGYFDPDETSQNKNLMEND